MSGWRWRELGAILALTAGLLASVGYYAVWTVVMFAAGIALAVGAHMAVPGDISRDT